MIKSTNTIIYKPQIQFLLDTSDCDYCQRMHNDSPSEFRIMSIKNDTIYYMRKEPDNLKVGTSTNFVHFSKVPKDLARSDAFKEYSVVWKDSLTTIDISNAGAHVFNAEQKICQYVDIARTAPNGYIINWDWDINSAEGISLDFSFFNCASKSIKYIDLYFSVYNDVGDRCKLMLSNSYTAKARGVGPVEFLSSGSWSWDDPIDYTTRDASKMKIVKVVITYMDGSTKTLTGNTLIIDE